MPPLTHSRPKGYPFGCCLDPAQHSHAGRRRRGPGLILAEVAARAQLSRSPLSLNKVVFEEHDGKVIYYSGYNDYFKKGM